MTDEVQTLDTFDIHAVNARAGAECLWAQMRDMTGLYHSDRYGGYYVAARYDDVLKVLTNPKVFSSARGITLPPPTAIRSMHVPAEVDPPMHGQYRALLMPFVTPEQARRREPAIRAIARELVAAIPDGEPVDFVRALARPLPIRVTLAFMDLPDADAPDLEDLVEALHRDVATGVSSGAINRLEDYARLALNRRRATAIRADEDLLSSIVLGEVAGRPLTEEEQVSMVRLLLIGGFDTTSATLAETARWLATNPDEAASLRADPTQIPAVVEELVRFTSPATYLRREVTEPVELGGTMLKPGDSVLVAFGAANRDVTRFACPDAIDPHRKPNPHLGFGAGNHRCIGSFIGKAELKVAFEEMLAAFSDFRIDESRPIRHLSGLGQGIIALPMVFTRARN
ncbi:cytochrome P450 [Novosphingobium sp. ERN07]|uniref:cytochrome P450 n=1 Tax=Novosphingobium sp. ERN07 TaxID=2726187 RepID=UPI0014566F7C|nr:cytochrome P450 [Novosphingobium sp. ERN07]NLR72980.1 cytochrome P450 [Novosphingobium sp. ERN07]